MRWAALGLLLMPLALAGCQGAMVGAGVAAGSAGAVTAVANATSSVATVVADAEAAAPTLFKNGCAAVSYADGAFKAASPALVASGRLSQAQLDQEAAIFASVTADCANPPADLELAGLSLVGKASAIYILLAAKPG